MYWGADYPDGHESAQGKNAEDLGWATSSVKCLTALPLTPSLSPSGRGRAPGSWAGLFPLGEGVHHAPLPPGSGWPRAG